MAITRKLDEKIHQTERKLRELSLHMQRLEREYQQLLQELALTPNQIKDFAQNPDNFSPAVWELLQEGKQQLNEKLKLELANVRDVSKAEEVFSEKGKIQQHWLFVR